MSRLLARVLIGLGLLVAAPALALAQAAGPSGPAAPAPKASATSNAALKAYILGSGDVVEVDVLGRSDFKTRAQVHPDGTIQLPLINEVKASGLTAQQLSDAVRKALITGGFFENPIVSVDIASYASEYVTVLGDVSAPGLVPVDRPYHLSEILARVGGVKDSAADYVIVRPLNGDERRLSIKLLATGDESQDPYVSPGDKIYSPAADTFFIYGQIRAPGQYSLDSELTLRKAIARGGGIAQAGSEGGIQIFRHGQKLSKVSLDSKIEAGDVIVIKERLF
jgi:polysaccharide export outer membrane protein